jgi:hypothetical protein
MVEEVGPDRRRGGVSVTDATAWIVVSPESAAFGSDHLSPTHLLVLSENDRATWDLHTIGQELPHDLVTWIPQSPSSFVHDAMLMLAVHVFQDEQILEEASQSIRDIGASRLDLNMPDRSADLASLYVLSRRASWRCLMVVTVLSHSSLRGVLEDFGQYPFRVRICSEDE